MGACRLREFRPELRDGSLAGDVLSDRHMSERAASFEHGQDIRDRSFDFACEVVHLCQTLYENGGIGRLLAPQLLDCSTSLASMMEEARASESTRDFVSKCSIGLKEARESHVRLRILERRRIGPVESVAQLRQEANELVSIVTAIVRNTKQNAARRSSRGHRALIPNS